MDLRRGRGIGAGSEVEDEQQICFNYRVLTGERRKPEPTTALPGSPEKIRVLAYRVSNREDLWHPLDARRQ